MDSVKPGYSDHIDLLPSFWQVTVMDCGTAVCKGVHTFTKDFHISSSGAHNRSVMGELGNSVGSWGAEAQEGQVLLPDKLRELEIVLSLLT